MEKSKIILLSLKTLQTVHQIWLLRPEVLQVLIAFFKCYVDEWLFLVLGADQLLITFDVLSLTSSDCFSLYTFQLYLFNCVFWFTMFFVIQVSNGGLTDIILLLTSSTKIQIAALESTHSCDLIRINTRVNANRLFILVCKWTYSSKWWTCALMLNDLTLILLIWTIQILAKMLEFACSINCWLTTTWLLGAWVWHY